MPRWPHTQRVHGAIKWAIESIWKCTHRFVVVGIVETLVGCVFSWYFGVSVFEQNPNNDD
jgi:hypothetical protein